MPKRPISLSSAVLVAVDVQRGFGKRAQSEKLRGLQPSESEEVRRNAQLAEAVFVAGGSVVATKDIHNRPGTVIRDPATGIRAMDDRADAEFKEWGEHVVDGTPDAELNATFEAALAKLEQRAGRSRSVVPIDRFDAAAAREGLQNLVEVRKNIYDVTKRLAVSGEERPNQRFIDLLRAKVKGQHGGAPARTLLVSGKIAEVCVQAAAASLKALFPEARVVVVVDAVSSLSPQSKQAAIDGLKALGVEVASTREVLLGFDFAQPERDPVRSEPVEESPGF